MVVVVEAGVEVVVVVVALLLLLAAAVVVVVAAVVRAAHREGTEVGGATARARARPPQRGARLACENTPLCVAEASALVLAHSRTTRPPCSRTYSLISNRLLGLLVRLWGFEKSVAPDMCFLRNL